jgi:hypothetical protein
VVSLKLIILECLQKHCIVVPYSVGLSCFNLSVCVLYSAKAYFSQTGILSPSSPMIVLQVVGGYLPLRLSALRRIK